MKKKIVILEFDLSDEGSHRYRIYRLPRFFPSSFHYAVAGVVSIIGTPQE